MTPDERWYEAVKHLKKATELLEGRMRESIVVDSHGTKRKEFRILFSEEVLDKEEQEG